MDNATTIKLINSVKDDIKEYIDLTGTVTRASFKAEVDRIHDMDTIRNGKIKTNKESVDLIKCETTFWRWAQRNRGFTIPAAVILISVIAIGAYKIDMRRTIQNHFDIEITE